MKKIFLGILYITLTINIFCSEYYKGKIFTTKILPVAVAVDQDQNIYVADQLTNSIMKYNKSGKYLFSFGLKATKKEKNIKVYPLITDLFIQNKTIYILDINTGIVIFDVEGNFLEKIDLKQGKLLGEVKKPQSIYASETNVYICDTENNRVQIMGPKGEVGREFGYKGNLPGNFIFPKGITAAEDYIVVSDTLNARVCVFNNDGFYEADFEIPDENLDLQFISPEDLFYDENDKRFYVIDSGTEQVKVFDEKYNLVLVFGQKGQKKTEFSGIRDIWVDKDRIYIADSANKCVKVFKKDFENIEFIKYIGKVNIFFVFIKLLFGILLFILIVRFIMKKIKEKRGIV